MDKEALRKAALSIADITNLSVHYFAEQGRRRIAAGNASVYDYFCIAYEKATPEERSKMLDAMAKLHEETFG